jgi:hypothetical protein
LDKGVKYGIALGLIGLCLFFFPFSSNGGTVFSTFFGTPFLSGQTGGTITNPQTGGTTTVSLINANQISFKFALIAGHPDGTEETVFSQSTLPGLAVLQAGKPVSYMDALAVAGIAVSTPLPSTATALFKLNFSAVIAPKTYACQILATTVAAAQQEQGEQQGQNYEGRVHCSSVPSGILFAPTVKWFYREVSSPLVNNGTLALAVLPAFRVLSSDVFATAAAQGEQRRVQWNLAAQVSVQAPGYSGLSLLGSTNALADFSFDGSALSGVTDTGTSAGAGTIGGAKLDKCLPGECGTAPPLPHPTTEWTEGTGEEGSTIYSSVTCTSTSCSVTPITSTGEPTGPTTTITVTSTGAVREDRCTTASCRGVEDTTTDTKTQTTTKETTSSTFKETSYTPGTRGEIAVSLLPYSADLPMLSYVQFNVGTNAYAVNPIVLFIVGLFVAFYAGYAYRKKL